MYTYQGRIYAERKGLQSTKSKNKEKEEEMDSFPTLDEPSIRVNYVCYAIIDPNETIIGYLNLTRHFPKRFSRGNQYNGWLSLRCKSYKSYSYQK